jgi:hypothetical protein
MAKTSFGRIVVSGILAAVLIGVMAAYLGVVSSLPGQIYTNEQQAFLSYNSSRSISQKAPMLNVIQSNEQMGDSIAALLPVQDSQVRATLAARYEEQGGVSVTMYDLDFAGEYQLTHTDPTSATVELFFPFPSNLETLHEVAFLVDDKEPEGVLFTTQGIHWQTVLEPGDTHNLTISYKADGANSFAYGLPQNQRANVNIEVIVLGLQGSEVPQKSLPATVSDRDEAGETFTWNYTGLIADRDIHLTLPARLSFTQRVANLQDNFMALAGLAPFLIGLFLLLLFGILRLADIRLRLESYLLIGCGLVLFYPLLTFLSGIFDVTLAAVLAFLLISTLLLTFLGLAVGWRQSWWRLGLLLVVFLGIFSFGLLTPWRGLLLTSGALLLVGIFMLLYARRATVPEPQVEDEGADDETPPAIETGLPVEIEAAPEPGETQVVVVQKEVAPPPAQPHCPHCGRALAADHNFCPGCGQDTQSLHLCKNCGHKQWIGQDRETTFCVNCGSQL